MKQKMKPVDISDIKVITLKESAEILGMNYHTARQRIMTGGLIGYFDYNGKIAVVEEDVRDYKRSHFVSPKKKAEPTILNKYSNDKINHHYLEIQESLKPALQEVQEKQSDLRIAEIKPHLTGLLELLLAWLKGNS
jgi:hypothetical protein